MTAPPPPDRLDRWISVAGKVNTLVFLGMATTATAVLSPVVIYRFAVGLTVSPGLLGASGLTAMTAIVGVLVKGALGAARRDPPPDDDPPDEA